MAEQQQPDQQQNYQQEDNYQQEGMKQYGRLGTEGMYGQGQYTNEGQPDTMTPEGQQMQPDQQEHQVRNFSGQPINRDVYSEQNDEEEAVLDKQFTPKGNLREEERAIRQQDQLQQDNSTPQS